MEKIINDIIMSIQLYKEDNPHVVITRDMIKNIVEGDIDLIVEEIKKELEEI